MISYSCWYCHSNPHHVALKELLVELLFIDTVGKAYITLYHVNQIVFNKLKLII